MTKLEEAIPQRMRRKKVQSGVDGISFNRKWASNQPNKRQPSHDRCRSRRNLNFLVLAYGSFVQRDSGRQAERRMALTMYINLFLKISTDFGNDLTRTPPSHRKILTNKTFLKTEFSVGWIIFSDNYSKLIARLRKYLIKQKKNR